MSAVTHKELVFRQSQDLDTKIKMSLERIHEWASAWKGRVHVSFSGGKDSTVLLHLVRSRFPSTVAVFVDTGLEYPEVKTVVRQFENVIRVRPKMKFGQVVEKYGWPVVSKKMAQYIGECQRPTKNNAATMRLRLSGYKTNGEFSKLAMIPKKWHKLMVAPFRVSPKCCKVIKKDPLNLYEKESNSKPFVGMMAGESIARMSMNKKNGCNAFGLKHPTSNPLAFWTEQDILRYIDKNDLPLARVYGSIEKRDGAMCLSGVGRTGCMFCAFGVHMEKEPNRFQQMKHTHPRHYDYVINKLGLGEVLDYIEVPYD